MYVLRIFKLLFLFCPSLSEIVCGIKRVIIPSRIKHIEIAIYISFIPDGTKTFLPKLFFFINMTPKYFNDIQPPFAIPFKVI